MSQVKTSQKMSLELVPMQVPDSATAATVFSRQSLVPQSLKTTLRLQPGEFSELVVRVKNHSEGPLQLQFSVTGDLPPDWWQLRTEGSTLPAHHQMEAVLYFAIAADFFEQPLSPEQLPLKLDHTGQLKVTATTPRGDSQEQISPFQVLVRPPSLYLDFLPDIYRNVDFVGRFLKIFETTFEPTVDILDHQWAYLDPLTAPQAMLPFLAHWVGWSFQGPLSLAQQRALIRYAMEIYRWRGTRRGLRFYLHLASGLPLDDHLPDESHRAIGIHENFNQGHVLGQTVLGQSTILGGHRPYHFSVRLRPPADSPTDYPLDETLIRTIIEQEKPAFCSYDLSIEPRP
ncbi:MAG: phage tail protein [Cyanobacteria bacterium J06635_1]